jgi:2-polyprenyl-6-methoxyphenol hydroxylase-like FAD-dependent oxidoreductase
MTSTLISGAGIAGPTLAYWLLDRGFEVTIVERAPAFREGGYVIDFWGVGFDVADRMGLIPRLREVGYRMDRLRFLDARGGTRSVLSPRTLRAAMGNRVLSIQRGDLARAIFDRIEGRVDVRFGDSITSIDSQAEGVNVSFQSGQRSRFDLVIGADGLHSAVRTLVFDAPTEHERFLGYVAAAFSTDAYPHREEHTYVSFAEPGRQVSRYALRDGKTVFLLVAASKTVPPVASPNAHGLHDPSAQKRWLRNAFQGLSWREAPEIFARLETADDLYFDAVTQIVLPAWSSGRTALLGDAAFCPSLLAGQGSAFAMLGAYILARELLETKGAPAAFDAYERRMRPFIEQKQRAARSFASSFTPSSHLGLFVRDQVMHLMNLPGAGPLIMSRMFKDRFTLPPPSP